ncbi:hypothetical protein FRB95_001289 [Tulasnella sp. JGI-2019a]|nr:hypothetical protein FRB95_001289 [Tulasnella sp. JGI-2019a]
MPPNREDDSAASALRKGAACLPCRKRKMRCDAGQPQCANCVKGKKECTYAAGRAKTKTQLLREKIQDLENKIKALEQQSGSQAGSGESSSSSPYPENGVYDDQEDDDGATSPDSDGRASAAPATSRKNSSETAASHGLDVTHLNGMNPLGLPLNGGTSSQSNWWDKPETPTDIRDFLLEEYMKRNMDSHCYVTKEEFRARLDLPTPECPHPALVNAMMLMGCHLTFSPVWTIHEPMFLMRARESLLASLAHSDRLFDFLLASNIVANYLYRTGRFLEGHHQTAGASRFAVSCGLHQIVSPVLEDNLEDPTRSVRASAPWSVSDMSVRRPGSMLSPPKDQYELGRRITAFWNTYLLDKLGSAITSLPGSLPDEADPLTEILTPFPRTLNEYLIGDVRNTGTATIRDLYDLAYWQNKRRRPETLQGLHVQITAIHERASRLSPVFLSDTTPNGREGFWQKVGLVELAITSFMREDLPGLKNTGFMGEVPPLSPNDPVNGVIFVIHTLAYLAIIQLHNSMAAEIPQSYDRVLNAARGVLKLAQMLSPSDYMGIGCEVVLSYAWTICAQVLIRQLRNQRSRFEDMTMVNMELDSIIGCLETLKVTYPAADFQLRKVAEWRQA